MKNLKNLIWLLILTVFVACQNDDVHLSSTNGTGNFDQGNSVQRDFFGKILDINGNPVSGANVRIGSTSVLTNTYGIFSLNNVTVKERFAYITVEKSGYINGSRVLVPTTGKNRVDIMLIPDLTTATINSGVSSIVSLPNGTKVTFDGSFKDENGNAYTGSVQVGLFHLESSDTYLDELMPGSLLATNSNNNSNLLETFGMLHVSLKGSSGQKLNIANGHTAEISMAIDASQLANSPNSIPLWSFDETTGIWKEEGSAAKQGAAYVGNVSHFSWWNCDTPLDFCTLQVHVENNSNVALANIKIELTRPSGTDTRSGYTNSNGDTSGLIPANEVLTMKLYDLCGNLIHTASIGPFASNSNNVLPTLTLSTSVQTLTIQGNLLNCAGAAVTDGIIEIAPIPNGNYYHGLSALVTNGTFSVTTSICSSSQQFRLVGYDITNLQTTGNITFTATAPITNIGNVTTCNAITEFISYQIDNGPIKNIFTNISCNYQTTSNSIYISAFGLNQQPPAFHLSMINVTGTGIVASYGMEFTNNANTWIGNSNNPNTTVTVNALGNVGQYVDVIVNGTYLENSISHTLQATIHVIRDN